LKIAPSTLQGRKSGKHKAWEDAFVHLQLLQPAQEQVVMDWVEHCATMGRPLHVSMAVKCEIYYLTPQTFIFTPQTP
jgi:hypothetical protein